MWTPPPDPDPSAILDGAVSDTKNGLHVQALEKFLWFHHNALRYCNSLYGVRLSFALSYWMDLAAVYPPALTAFVRTRDETEAAFRANSQDFHLFHDLAALNRSLGQGARTADVFISAMQGGQALAQSLYSVAQPYLIAIGRYDVCGRFIDSNQIEEAAHCYKIEKDFEDNRPSDDDQPPKTARRFFIEEVATLVGLLVLNQRAEVAHRVREQALAVLDDAEFRTMLRAALCGHLPPSLFEK
jgi:hypothetical protein